MLYGRTWRFVLFLSAMLFAGSLPGPFAVSTTVQAKSEVTFTVNSTADPGDGVCDVAECTLREAISTANGTAGADVIAFNIPGSGVRTISPSSALPIITDTVTIDGYSQPGASPNTLSQGNNAVLLIELDGTNVAPGSAVRISAGNSRVRGLVINRFLNSGIVLQVAGQNVIEGNFIGTDASGTVGVGTGGTNISLQSSGNVIGGIDPGARNLLSAGEGFGVYIGAPGNYVQNNYIGTDKNGTADLDMYGDGVYIAAANNVIGGTAPGAGNLIRRVSDLEP